MTGLELKAIREARGENQIQFGRALGYRMVDKALQVHISRLETQDRLVPFQVALIAQALMDKVETENLEDRRFLKR